MNVTPYVLESLTSLVARASAMQAMNTDTFLRGLFPSEEYQRPVPLPDDLDALGHGAFLEALNDSLDPDKRRLSQMTLPGAERGVHTKWLRRAGGNNDDGDRFGSEPDFAWCPRCLLRDKLNGHDQFLRLSWRIVTRTLCTSCRRPLTTHCLDCNDRNAKPAFIYADGKIVIACGCCGSPYASQLGLPDMSPSTALELSKNHRVQVAWRGATSFELALENSLFASSKKRDKGQFRDFAFAFANILMRSKVGGRSSIDLFASAAFPAKKNPQNITSMARPYRASSIAVRRKTHALMHTLIKNRVNLFVIRGVSHGQWGRDPTFQELRADFEPEQNAELDRLLLRFPANWY